MSAGGRGMANVLVLAIAQALSASGLTVLILLGSIVASGMAPRASWATVPVSLAVLAGALSTAPAALLMRRTGRRAGFVLGACLGAIGAVVAAWAITRGNFALMCCAGMLFGSSTAFGQQYRFAAAESVSPDQVSKAVSWILMGGLGAALLGPFVALQARYALPQAEYAGSFLAVAVLYVVAIFVLLRLRVPAPVGAAAPQPARPAGQLLRDPRLRVAVLAGVTAFGVMSFVMTAAPISMHVHHHHSVASTTWVIQSHVIAMFLPSLFTGRLVARFGERTMMVWGALLLAGCIAVSLAGQAVVHYWWGLVLLGVGWNLLFVAGTTMLAREFADADRHRAQAINEFTVFGTQACVSLLAGVVVSTVGWQLLNIATLPLLLLMLVAAAGGRRTAAASGPAATVRAD